MATAPASSNQFHSNATDVHMQAAVNHPNPALIRLRFRVRSPATACLYPHGPSPSHNHATARPAARVRVQLNAPAATGALAAHSWRRSRAFS
jgi:hypothetical protein